MNTEKIFEVQNRAAREQMLHSLKVGQFTKLVLSDGAPDYRNRYAFIIATNPAETFAFSDAPHQRFSRN